MARKPDSPFRQHRPSTRPHQHLCREAKPSTPVERRAGHDVYQSAKWAKLSAKLRKEVGHCEKCGRNDGQLYVDHVIELRDGGPAWDRSNLMVLCAHCHTTKTKAAAKDRVWRPLAEQLEDQLRSAGWAKGDESQSQVDG
ncbi:HNH endonuclease signature motif containing protein [Pseudomonas sp. OV226]|uniref:HNH endonuclease signature motif containing protein n=1 Tax=Pseudomonas sp. OV226 TaxID=2135588 RepID=UPI000D6BDAE0|nr:HNH endonuclease [Pseudomonas sp. OV226]PWK32571.1 5-methylcytosine-specific restriction endonuclease McrA [Pseudomonas sp. OV226]